MRNDRRGRKASNILGDEQTVEQPQPFEARVSERESVSASDDEATPRRSVADEE